MRQNTITEAKNGKVTMDKNVCHVIFVKGLSFHLVKSSYFKKALESYRNFSRGYVSLSYHEARITYRRRLGESKIWS